VSILDGADAVAPMAGPPGWFVNPDARAWLGADRVDCLDFHARLPGYAATPLRPITRLAERLGLGAVLVKDESDRFGLPAFKFLGASRGVYLALCQRLGGEPAWRDVADLRRAFAGLDGVRLVAASAGNHGRAVARMARLIGVPAVVLLPAGTAAPMVASIAGEGAEVRLIDGGYDDSVATAMRLADSDRRHVLVQDTAWPGYEQVPGWILDGYGTLFREVDEQLAGGVDLVVVPVGVGSLLAAAIQHYRAAGLDAGGARPVLLAVEPDTAACVLASLRAGEPVTVPTGGTIMAGLNSGKVSSLSWPLARAGLDCAITVTDMQARAAQAQLAESGVFAGPCGAAALAGLDALLSDQHQAAVRAALGLSPSSTVVLISTDASPQAAGPA
jgi:diaminopropionate ammonia-lyase